MYCIWPASPWPFHCNHPGCGQIIVTCLLQTCARLRPEAWPPRRITAPSSPPAASRQSRKTELPPCCLGSTTMQSLRLNLPAMAGPQASRTEIDSRKNTQWRWRRCLNSTLNTGISRVPTGETKPKISWKQFKGTHGLGETFALGRSFPVQLSTPPPKTHKETLSPFFRSLSLAGTPHGSSSSSRVSMHRYHNKNQRQTNRPKG